MVEFSKSRRRGKMFSSGPPPVSQELAPPASTSATGGLYASGSFYSLVAGGSGGSGLQSRQQQQQQTQQNQSLPPAVRLEPGTRNLILTRPLDREAGAESILLQIQCRPRNGRPKQEESSTIPVRIMVTDANDQAPEFVGVQPYVVNISETAPLGSVASRDILALDRDSAGPFSTLNYRVVSSSLENSGELSLFQFANPLDPTLLVSGPLDYETLGPSFTLTIAAQDQGEPEALSATAQVLVNIIGELRWRIPANFISMTTSCVCRSLFFLF